MQNNFLMICLNCKEKGSVVIVLNLEKKELQVSCANCKKVEKKTGENENIVK